MKNFTWFIAFIALPFGLGFYSSCSAEKKVLKDTEKTNRVVAKWLQTNPLKIDTFTTYRTGDTITQLLIAYDTTHITDTLKFGISVDCPKITKTVYKTITRVDTLVKTIMDNRLIAACQKNLATYDYDKKQAIVARDGALVSLRMWKLKFWAVVVGLGIVGASIIAFRIWIRK